jgi:hypothetical protein
VVVQGVKIQYTFAANGRSVSFTEVMAEPGSAQPGSAQTGRDAQPGAMLNRARCSTGRDAQPGAMLNRA